MKNMIKYRYCLKESYADMDPKDKLIQTLLERITTLEKIVENQVDYLPAVGPSDPMYLLVSITKGDILKIQYHKRATESMNIQVQKQNILSKK